MNGGHQKSPPPSGFRHLLSAPHLMPSHKEFKVIHLVRHGEGTHNVTHDYHSEEHFDASLTDRGKSQAREAGRLLKQHSIELVVASPLSRALQTAHGAVHDHPDLPPFVVHEACREVMGSGLEPCNRRRHVSELTERFPNVESFHHHYDAVDHDAGWVGDETDQEVVERGQAFLDFLLQRPEKHIAVFTHSVFLHTLLNQGVECRNVKRQFFNLAEVRTVILHPREDAD